MEKVMNFIKKFTKIPTIIWVMVSALSYYFANIYALEVDFNAGLEILNEQLATMGVSYPINENGYRIFSYIFSCLLIVGIFEMFLYFIYRSFSVRQQISNEKEVFKTTARFVFIAANIIIGLFALLYFAYSPMYSYGRLLFNFIVYTAAYTFGYYLLTIDVMHPRFIAKAFMRLFTIYFVYSGVESLFSMMTAINENVFVLQNVLKFVVVVIAAATIYFTVYKKLLTREKENNNMPPPSDINAPPPSEIYKGFGF